MGKRIKKKKLIKIKIDLKSKKFLIKKDSKSYRFLHQSKTIRKNLKRAVS